MEHKQAYETLRLDFLFVKADDIVTTSPPFDNGDQDGGTDLPPDFN